MIDRIKELIGKICGDTCVSCKISCCMDCASNKAHFEIYPYMRLSNISFYTVSDRISRAIYQFELLCREYGFGKYGFRGSDGCVLPWEKRPYRCLVHFCGNVEKTEAYKKYFPELNKLLNQLREDRKNDLL